MRILLVSTYARSGGASIAARRLCTALNGVGGIARVLVQQPEGVLHPDLLSTHDPVGPYRPMIDALPAWPWRNRRSPHWGTAWIDNSRSRSAIHHFSPDVTHLHWVNHGMLSVPDIARLRRPLIWTLHDSWAFTGGCHSPQECQRYEHRCGRCPELRSSRERDLSRWIWNRKNRVWRSAPFVVVTPSHWLAKAARRSSLLKERRIEIIPNAVDTAVFAPTDRVAARGRLGLPHDAPVFLFGAHGAATDWNKGMDLWRAALPVVFRRYPHAVALVAGMSSDPLRDLPVSVRALGILNPESMATAMVAADVTVVPSRMENLPNIVAESLTCGTPIAAFAVGGIPEMIEPGRTGILAKPHDPVDLADGICTLLASGGALREHCVAASAAYDPERVALRHMDLYRALLETE